VSDPHTCNHAASRLPAPQLPKLVRRLWVMTLSPNTSVIAGIYGNPYGWELRVSYGENESHVIMTEVSREGDAPLEARANELRLVLRSMGWSSAT
jgi:hypothetical protein